MERLNPMEQLIHQHQCGDEFGKDITSGFLESHLESQPHEYFAYCLTASILFKASDIRTPMAVSRPRELASVASSENRFFQYSHRSRLMGGMLSQSGPVLSDLAVLSSSSSFEFRSSKMGYAHWIIHSLATHTRHSIAGPFSGDSSSAILSCQIGRLSQGAKPVLVSRAMNEFKLFHLAKS